MPPAQHHPEPTAGALNFDPEGRPYLMKSHKWAGRYVVLKGHVELGETLVAALRLPIEPYTEKAILAYLAGQNAW